MLHATGRTFNMFTNRITLFIPRSIISNN